jgi:peptide/nickel transport system ATP-binding protein
MSEKLIEIKNLKVIYDTDEEKVQAVNGINLTVNKGETLGLVGETGAGKTTLALSIMGLLPDKIGFIKEGEILFNGIDLTKAKEGDLRLIRGEHISMIFQDPMTSLNPILTVGEQISEVLELHRKELNKEQIDKRVEEILKLVGLAPERKDDFPHEFSGGMKQRVVIAIALACEPDLLLADEPTTALDVTIQAQVLEMMKTLKSTFNTSMILITHDLGVVAQTCDRVGIVYAGEIVEFGTVEDIFESKYHHPYTVGLFGSIPDLTTKTKRLKPIEGLMPDPTDLPEGCNFYPRCSKCMEKCKTIAPKDIVRNGHLIKCHLFDDRNA